MSILAKTAGFCFGVDRAVKMANRIADSGIPAASLGPIINNRLVVDALADRGVRVCASADELRDGETAVICAHGAAAEVYERLQQRGIAYIDATCPCVARIHKIVTTESADGRTVVILGDREHVEVDAVASRSGDCRVFRDDIELSEWLQKNSNLAISVVSQTTLDTETWEKSLKILKKVCTNLKTFDTICNATFSRQRETAELAQRMKKMVVVGDRRSANTRRLYEICRRLQPDTVWIESADELSDGGDYKDVGISAGASTPMWIIEEVCKKMSDEIKINMTGEEPEVDSAPVEQVEDLSSVEVVDTSVEPIAEEAVVVSDVAEEETQEPMGDSFEELLEQSLKTLNSGEKVTGLVTSINGTEIQVDLGTKHSGYIPMSELSEDPNVKPEDIAQVGQEIECYVVRVNDGEGTAMLSRKRLDTMRGWEEVEAAVESGDIMEGTVTEENKGGIVVTVKGVRVFVPASHTGVPRDGDMSALLKTRVKLKINEVNRARRRVVGSIRDVERQLRRAAAETVWGTIEIGNEYSGAVKSILSYGAFVDIGGVDGMVHISEMSWQRVRHPSDIMTVGDVVKVRVIGLDRDKHKISLSMRDEGENPWTKFSDAYEIGAVIKAKVVKLMVFGAFAEIIPGVDGLIHISQISDERVGKPGDVLSEGQEVDVKITNIDYTNQKVWLSIRALIEPDVSDDGDDAGYTTDTVVAVSEEGKLEVPADNQVLEGTPAEVVDETSAETTEE